MCLSVSEDLTLKMEKKYRNRKDIIFYKIFNYQKNI